MWNLFGRISKTLLTQNLESTHTCAHGKQELCRLT